MYWRTPQQRQVLLNRQQYRNGLCRKGCRRPYTAEFAFGNSIFYTREEYESHLNATLQYQNKNYKAVLNQSKVFQNISITEVAGQYVQITKNKDPAIHFIIYHPKLMHAIENFEPIFE